MPLPDVNQMIMIRDFLIDCSLRESHTFDSDVTDYPVESGSNITDNIRPLPITVEIEGIVTNTPIGPIAITRTGDKTPADTAYELFLDIRSKREPVTIRTSLRTFENMALKSLSIPRGDHEDALKFTAQFQQIETKENLRSIRPSIPIATRHKKVTRAPDPNASRLIAINVARKEWYDPDTQSWTRWAIFKQSKSVRIVDGADGSSTTYPPEITSTKWHLYRSLGTPVGSSVTAFPVTNIIAVPYSMCVLHDFVIKTTISGSAGNPRTDAAR